MFGYAPKLPMRYDFVDGGYALTKTFKENTLQNLKHLILTSPGEKVMMPGFGVGLKRYLWEPDINFELQVEQKIITQVARYMPFVTIENILFSRREEDSSAPYTAHVKFVRVVFSIAPYNEMMHLDVDT